jgi:predicted unusual protein kinase regulating ubiquinone biosynthesis (AarF/ABC1/UbiB family)
VYAAIAADLDNTALLTQMLGLIFTGLDVAPFVAELRQRVGEELDYRLEADRQRRFARLYEGHPAIVIPRVHDALSTRHVLTTDLSAGRRFEATDAWEQPDRDLAAEVIYRFVFRSLNRHLLFNGDPHPGNYLFEKAGPLGVRVTFLDFGLVKEFTPAEISTFHSMIRHQVIEHDGDAYRATVEAAGLLRPGAPYTTAEIMDFFGYFYRPVLEDRPFTYTTEFAREALRRTFDPNGPHTEVMRWLNLPPAFVVLNRIQWGLNAVLASLDATANWRRIAEELWPFTDGPPSTPLGEAEAQWLVQRAATTG